MAHIQRPFKGLALRARLTSKRRAQHAGYSATPLVRKLGIKPGHTPCLRHGPPGWAVPDLPDGVKDTDDLTAADVVIAFYRRHSELVDDVAALAALDNDWSGLKFVWRKGQR